MGFLGDLGELLGSTADFAVSAGGKLLTATVDFENWTVSLADEIWTAIPGELIAPGLGPLAGVLKNEFEDELFMMAGPFGLVAGLGVFPVQFDRAAQEIVGGLALVGAIKHRKLNDEEWRMASWVFGDQLPPRDNIRLTNFGVPKKPLQEPLKLNRAITFFAIANQYYVNLGPNYCHRSTTTKGPLLLHELTHVWQGRNKIIRDIQLLTAAKDRDYDYTLGGQWRDYGVEQQATIVEDWAGGTVENQSRKHRAGPVALGSPLFRYIHKNIRQNDNGTRSPRGTSVRALAAPFPASKDLPLSRIHPPGPRPWWS